MIWKRRVSIGNRGTRRIQKGLKGERVLYLSTNEVDTTTSSSSVPNERSRSYAAFTNLRSSMSQSCGAVVSESCTSTGLPTVSPDAAPKVGMVIIAEHTHKLA